MTQEEGDSWNLAFDETGDSSAESLSPASIALIAGKRIPSNASDEGYKSGNNNRRQASTSSVGLHRPSASSTTSTSASTTTSATTSAAGVTVVAPAPKQADVTNTHTRTASRKVSVSRAPKKPSLHGLGISKDFGVSKPSTGGNVLNNATHQAKKSSNSGIRVSSLGSKHRQANSMVYTSTPPHKWTGGSINTSSRTGRVISPHNSPLMSSFSSARDHQDRLSAGTLSGLLARHLRMKSLSSLPVRVIVVASLLLLTSTMLSHSEHDHPHTHDWSQAGMIDVEAAGEMAIPEDNLYHDFGAQAKLAAYNEAVVEDEEQEEENAAPVLKKQTKEDRRAAHARIADAVGGKSNADLSIDEDDSSEGHGLGYLRIPAKDGEASHRDADPNNNEQQQELTDLEQRRQDHVIEKEEQARLEAEEQQQADADEHELIENAQAMLDEDAAEAGMNDGGAYHDDDAIDDLDENRVNSLPKLTGEDFVGMNNAEEADAEVELEEVADADDSLFQMNDQDAGTPPRRQMPQFQTEDDVETVKKLVENAEKEDAARRPSVKEAELDSEDTDDVENFKDADTDTDADVDLDPIPQRDLANENDIDKYMQDADMAREHAAEGTLDVDDEDAIPEDVEYARQQARVAFNKLKNEGAGALAAPEIDGPAFAAHGNGDTEMAAEDAAAVRPDASDFDADVDDSNTPLQRQLRNGAKLPLRAKSPKQHLDVGNEQNKVNEAALDSDAEEEAEVTEEDATVIEEDATVVELTEAYAEQAVAEELAKAVRTPPRPLMNKLRMDDGDNGNNKLGMAKAGTGGAVVNVRPAVGAGAGAGVGADKGMGLAGNHNNEPINYFEQNLAISNQRKLQKLRNKQKAIAQAQSEALTIAQRKLEREKIVAAAAAAAGAAVAPEVEEEVQEAGAEVQIDQRKQRTPRESGNEYDDSDSRPDQGQAVAKKAPIAQQRAARKARLGVD